MWILYRLWLSFCEDPDSAAIIASIIVMLVMLVLVVFLIAK